MTIDWIIIIVHLHVNPPRWESFPYTLVTVGTGQHGSPQSWKASKSTAIILRQGQRLFWHTTCTTAQYLRISSSKPTLPNLCHHPGVSPWPLHVWKLPFKRPCSRANKVSPDLALSYDIYWLGTFLVFTFSTYLSPLFHFSSWLCQVLHGAMDNGRGVHSIKPGGPDGVEN